MKLFNYALLVVGSLMAVTSFASTPAPDCGTDLETITVGTQFGVPPYAVLSSAGVASGFDISIACELRKRLGFNSIQIRQVNPNGTVVLSTGAATIIVSALSEINPTALATRALVKYADFAYGLLYNGTVPAGTTPSNALAELAANGGSTVGALVNSYELNVLAATPDITVASFATVADAIVALKAGTIAAFFSNNVVVDTAHANDATVANLDNVIVNTTLFPATIPFVSTGLGIALDSSCCQLYANVAAAIAAMVADGTYAAIAKANGVPTTFTAATLTPSACTGTIANLPVRNAIANFIFDKYCKCVPTILPVGTTVTAGGAVVSGRITG